MSAPSLSRNDIFRGISFETDVPNSNF